MGLNAVWRRRALVAAVLGCSALSASGSAFEASAQTTPAAPTGGTPAAPATPPQTPTSPAPATPAPAAPATPAPATPAPAAPATPAPAAPANPAENPPTAAPDNSAGQIIEVQPRPVVQLSGQATWDDGFKTLDDAFNKLSQALGKAGIKAAGNPEALFTSTDDAGFKYTAMIPVEKAPDGKPDVPADVSFAQSPGGRAMRFQHRGAYDDIDSTYEAITAYLDEKGLEAKNMFAEDYLNRTKTSDDPGLEVDILVFLK